MTGRSPSAVSHLTRIDPVHEIRWEDGIDKQWNQIAVYKEALGATEDGRVRHKITPEFSPIRKSDYHLFSTRAILAMAAINEFEQLTTHQIATWLGVGVRAATITLNHLFEAGILQVMRPGWMDDKDKKDVASPLWRIDRKSWTTVDWFGSLNHMEWALVTNGSDPEYSSIGATNQSAVRHNMASSELVLKAMEICPAVIGGWGERHAIWDMFVDPEKIGMDLNVVGDSVVVTRDGKIIVFEVTTTKDANRVGTDVAAKAAAWVTVAAYSDLNIHVVFADMTGTGTALNRISRMVLIGIEHEASKYIPHKDRLEHGQSRIHAFSGLDWFPMPRVASDDMRDLVVHRVIDGRRVQLSNLGAEVRMDDHVVNTLAAMHVPFWIKNDVA